MRYKTTVFTDLATQIIFQHNQLDQHMAHRAIHESKRKIDANLAIEQDDDDSMVDIL